MASPYVIRTVVFVNGERMPVLVHADNFQPVFDATVYATTVVRPRSGSSALIEQALRGVQLLLTFLDFHAINLAERFRNGKFLHLHELDDLVRWAYMPMTSLPGTKKKSAVLSPKLLNTRAAIRRSPAQHDAPGVEISTASIKLYYARAYLEWFGAQIARQVCSDLAQKVNFMELLREFLFHLRSRTPPSHKDANRVGLETNQKSELLRVIDPHSKDNPWQEKFVRERNRLLILWGLTTGLRRGELLGLRIKLIDLRRNMVDVVRRPDDKKDPRKNQPNTKTRERRIGISEELAYLTHEHIVKHRSKVPGAAKHDFLFISDSGRPLSLAGLSKVFTSLRAKHSAIGDDFSSHVLRHTWNEDFSEVADNANMSAEDERRARNHSMGWSDYSKSADHYLKRRTRRLATAASIKIQQSAINTEGVKDDGE